MKKLPENFIFMKVGQHAGEDFERILARKREEYRRAGMTFWGYGGPTCHPITQIRPFVREVVARGGGLHLLMESMDSKADPDIVPATEYSEDGIVWKPLPNGIIVTGSRYAIVLGEIREEELELPLHDYAVALGRSEGRNASQYLQGRVDKACLSLDSSRAGAPEKPRLVQIKYSAEVIEPYAVLLRGGD